MNTFFFWYNGIFKFITGVATWMTISTLTYLSFKHFHAQLLWDTRWYSALSVLTAYFVIYSMWNADNDEVKEKLNEIIAKQYKYNR